MRAVAIFLIVLLISLLPALNAGSEKISIKSTTVNEGMEARVKIILDSAPKGLAGYDITVSLRDSGVASILKADFPQWAKLSDSSIKGNSINLKAVDLDDRIRPGATNIELATIIFGNTKRGESLIELTVNRIDDDEGKPITPSIELGKLTVIIPSTTQTSAITITPTITPTITTVNTPTITPTTRTYTIITSTPFNTVVMQTPLSFYIVLVTAMLLAFAAVVGVLAIIHMRRRKPRIIGVGYDSRR